MYCANCGNEIKHEKAVVCVECGCAVTRAPIPGAVGLQPDGRRPGKRGAAIWLVLFGGWFGLYRFYNGSFVWGIFHLLLFLVAVAFGIMAAVCYDTNDRESGNLRRNLSSDARVHVQQHFREKVAQEFYLSHNNSSSFDPFLKYYLSDWYDASLKGSTIVGRNWTRGEEKIPEEEVDRVQRLLDNLAEEGVRQSAFYHQWRNAGSPTWGYCGPYFVLWGFCLAITVFTGVLLELICIVDFFRFVFMGKAGYDARYNVRPPHPLKW